MLRRDTVHLRFDSIFLGFLLFYCSVFDAWSLDFNIPARGVMICGTLSEGQLLSNTERIGSSNISITFPLPTLSVSLVKKEGSA